MYIFTTMSRPKPTVLLQHSNKTTYKMDEVLAAEGARIAILGRDPQRSLDVASELRERHGVDAIGEVIASDDEAGVTQAVTSAAERIGPGEMIPRWFESDARRCRRLGSTPT